MASRGVRKVKSTKRTAAKSGSASAKAKRRPATKGTAAEKPARKGAAAARKRPASTKRPAARKPASSRRSVRAQPTKAPASTHYHTVTPLLNVRDAEQAIDFLKQAFGAQERMRMPAADGKIMHAELVIGDSTIMLSDAVARPETRSSMHLYVDDCDVLFERAIAAGGVSRMPLQDMFWGDRYGQLEDPFGNVWTVATHKEDVEPEELARRAAQAGEQFALGDGVNPG